MIAGFVGQEIFFPRRQRPCVHVRWSHRCTITSIPSGRWRRVHVAGLPKCDYAQLPADILRAHHMGRAFPVDLRGDRRDLRLTNRRPPSLARPACRRLVDAHCVRSGHWRPLRQLAPSSCTCAEETMMPGRANLPRDIHSARHAVEHCHRLGKFADSVPPRLSLGRVAGATA